MESHAHIDSDAYLIYYHKILNVLSKLSNDKSLEAQAEMLAELRNLDQQYIDSQSSPLQTDSKYIFFTRHAKCSYEEKDLGFAPNATVEKLALNAIDKSGSITQNLFRNKHKRIAAVSPLIRAQQTAKHLIPDNFGGPIEIMDFLSENSSYPSGKPLLSKDDLEKEGDAFSVISKLSYGEAYFNELKAISDTTKAAISLKSSTKSLEDSSQNRELTELQKINCINLYIASKEDDIWFIGHGANTRNYFQTRYLIDKDMEYCETRKIIHYIDIYGDHVEFVTPYFLSINQENGLFQGAMLSPDMKLITYSNPIKELSQYIILRVAEHEASAKKAEEDEQYAFIKNFTLFAKQVWGNDFETKINAARHLLSILKNESISPLIESEKDALKENRLGDILIKYKINLDNLFQNKLR